LQADYTRNGRGSWRIIMHAFGGGGYEYFGHGLIGRTLLAGRTLYVARNCRVMQRGRNWYHFELPWQVGIARGGNDTPLVADSRAQLAR
jgi:hypothetical protein